MNQTIFAVVLAVTLGIVLGSPLQSCDKLRNVKEGADNYNQYLIKLKDSDDYMDAEYIINRVNQYQTILQQYVSNVHEPLVRSQLELSENAAGVLLHGTLSHQALILVSSHQINKCKYYMLPSTIFIYVGMLRKQSRRNFPKLSKKPY